MTLTFSITDRELSVLKDTLRIKKEDFNITGKMDDYPKRILQARMILGMDNVDNEACYDFLNATQS